MSAFRKWVVILFLFPFSGNQFLFCQNLDYKQVFGDDWKKAEAFEKENREWMKPLIEKNRIPYPVAIAVIFPELVRYSSIRDKIEITLLKALYINSGDQYADFSIGVFQMKPSFADLIARESQVYIRKKSSLQLVYPSMFDDEKEYRKALVSRLENHESELLFVIAFIKICGKKYNIDIMNIPESVRFLSTAYNCGIDKTAERICQMMNMKYFNTGIVKSSLYSYADVSMYWFNKNKLREDISVQKSEEQYRDSAGLVNK